MLLVVPMCRVKSIISNNTIYMYIYISAIGNSVPFCPRITFDVNISCDMIVGRVRGQSNGVVNKTDEKVSMNSEVHVSTELSFASRSHG